ncbi:MAG: YcxB family protein [Alistipes sp.]|nr:YcxB family protein [Alistipes sp.]
MTVSYTISLDDLIAFQAHYMDHDRKVSSVVKYMMWGTAMLLILLLGIKAVSTHTVETDDILVLVFFGALFFLFWKLLRKTSVRIAKKLYDQPGNASLLGAKTLTLGEEMLELTEEWKRTCLQWKGVVKAGETKDHFFIYDSALSAITVPKKGLNGNADRFRAILTGHGLLP